jgi:hypothetical protein
MSHSGFIGAVRNSTIIGQVQGAPVQAHSLPNSVSKTSPALWVTKGHFVCEKTLAEFLTANGGPGRVIFVPFKNKQDPTMLAGHAVGRWASCKTWPSQARRARAKRPSQYKVRLCGVASGFLQSRKAWRVSAGHVGCFTRVGQHGQLRGGRTCARRFFFWGNNFLGQKYGHPIGNRRCNPSAFATASVVLVATK